MAKLLLSWPAAAAAGFFYAAGWAAGKAVRIGVWVVAAVKTGWEDAR